MASKESNNIIRYSGETMPSNSTIKIDGVALDISDDWVVEVRYKVPTGTELPNGHGIATTETELIIDCVIPDGVRGKVSIYPHARCIGDDVLTPSKYITSELHDRLIEKAIAEGTSVNDVPSVNQVWDDAEVESAIAGGSLEYPFYLVRSKSFNTNSCEACYREEQVHNCGLIQIASRWLK